MSVITGAAGAKLGGMAAGTFGWTATTWSQIGWTAGVLAGNYLFAPDGPDVVTEGPRLSDLKTTSSAYGVGIPKVFGAYRISGNIIWALPLQETKHEETQEEGKGGGGGSSTNIWYTYAATFAVALCEGPISGIRKIWFGSVLVYDDGAYREGISSANVQIYDGTVDQDIDWTMQSKNPDSPAYRNVAYVIFNGIQVGDFGNAIPNVTCEVVKSGTYGTVQLPYIQLPKYFNHDIRGGGFYGVDDDYFYFLTYNYTFSSSQDGYVFEKVLKNGSNYWHETTSVTNICDEGEDSEYSCTASFNGFSYFPFCSGIDYNTVFVGLSDGFYTMSTSANCCDDNYIKVLNSDIDRQYVVWYKDKFMLDWGDSGPILYANMLSDQVTISYGHQNDGITKQTNMCVYDDLAYVFTAKANEIEVSVYDENLLLISNTIKTGISLYLLYTGTMTVDHLGYHLVKGSSTGYYTLINFDLEVIKEQTFYETGGLGSITGEEAYYHNGNIYIHEYIVLDKSYTDRHVAVWAVDKISISEISLQTVVEELLASCGLQPNDYDASDGSDTFVKGYVISRNSSVRGSIEPLLSAYEFALVETGSKIVLRKQNQIPLASIPEEDFIEESGSKIEYNITQESDLMKKLSLRYSNKDSGYGNSVQSTMRIDTKATEEITIELPLVLTDDEAKQLAEKSIYKNWMSREKFSFSLPFSYSYLISGDVITVIRDGRTNEVRLTTITLTEDNYLRCLSMANYGDAFSSTSIGQPTDTDTGTGTVPDNIGISTLAVLNAPTLDNSLINSEGVYVVSTGYSDSWSGCSVYSKSSTSDDFSNDITLIGGTAIARVDNLIGPGSTGIWDFTNTIQISNCSEDLFELSFSEVLNGGNYIFVGREIIQYANLTYNGENRYTLYNLLRGRRGTESEVNSHSSGESFVLLKNSPFGFINKTISNNDYYASLSLGKNISDLLVLGQVTYNGVNLKPFSPSMLKATYEVNNDVTLTWMRRSRYISGYMKTLPLSESTELYEVDVVMFENGSVLSTHQITSSAFTYTEAMQILDGFSTGEDSPIGFYAYQVSSVYGRGEASYISVGVTTLETYQLSHWKLDEINHAHDPIYLIDEVSGLDFYDSGWGYSTLNYEIDPLVSDSGHAINITENNNGGASVYTENSTLLSLTKVAAVSLFFNRHNDTDAMLFNKRREYAIFIDHSDLKVVMFDNNDDIIRQEELTVAISATTNHLVCVNFSGTNHDSEFTIYVDSVLRTDKIITTDNSKEHTEASTRTYLGGEWADLSVTYYNTDFDDVRAFSQPLTPDQIQIIWDMRNF